MSMSCFRTRVGRPTKRATYREDQYSETFLHAWTLCIWYIGFPKILGRLTNSRRNWRSICFMASSRKPAAPAKNILWGEDGNDMSRTQDAHEIDDPVVLCQHTDKARRQQRQVVIISKFFAHKAPSLCVIRLWSLCLRSPIPDDSWRNVNQIRYQSASQ